MRVRFAPSPTGALHIGGVRTALYNYLLAKKHGGTFLLRVEDTDQTRFVPGAEDYILNSLRWLGIMPTEGQNIGGEYGPYRQSERKALYGQYVQQLLDSDKAYYAFDTPEQLDNARKVATENGQNFQYGTASRMQLDNSLSLSAAEVQARIASGAHYVVRMKIPANEQVLVRDIIRGEVTFATQELDDKVLMKADGMPTYHLANIVDDHLMKITHVIRGEEWLPSAAHHVLLYQSFGWEATMPQFAHLPLILKPDGNGKLSKRDGAKFGFPVFPMDWKSDVAADNFMGFDGAGFEPEAVLNFLALLGWSSGTEQEMFSLDQLSEAFSLERINKAGARFNYDKAKWFNQQYILAMDNAILAAKVKPLAEAKGYNVSPEYLESACRLMKERVAFTHEILDKGYYLFDNNLSYDNETIKKKWKSDFRPKIESTLSVIENANIENAIETEEQFKEFMVVNDLKMGEILPFLRLSLAGTMQGPAVFDMAALLGKTETIRRIKAGLDVFDGVIVS
jgi:glutamyl-tRNA synthetase